jgi:LysR family glycine cleavage system transcriptional activator
MNLKEPLPPLNAIKVFEAVARSGNMARAAEELHVSPSAVSHQIKALESWFERQLFDRQGRELLLNEDGRRFIDVVHPAFQQLRLAARRMQEPPGGRLKVAICPSLASTWLVPRLSAFLDLHPQISVELHSQRETVDLTRSSFDCALRYCREVPRGHVGQVLMAEDIFPVCAPSLSPITSLNDLRDHRLLHDALGELGVSSCSWSTWLSEVGVPELARSEGAAFSDSNILYEAACLGMGVALGRSVLVANQLASGRLIRPFDISMRSTHSWYFISTADKLITPSLTAFRDWLLYAGLHRSPNDRIRTAFQSEGQPGQPRLS